MVVTYMTYLACKKNDALPADVVCSGLKDEAVQQELPTESVSNSVVFFLFTCHFGPPKWSIWAQVKSKTRLTTTMQRISRFGANLRVISWWCWWLKALDTGNHRTGENGRISKHCQLANWAFHGCNGFFCSKPSSTNRKHWDLKSWSKHPYLRLHLQSCFNLLILYLGVHMVSKREIQTDPFWKS